jgi:hypothetical protein
MYIKRISTVAKELNVSTFNNKIKSNRNEEYNNTNSFLFLPWLSQHYQTTLKYIDKNKQNVYATEIKFLRNVTVYMLNNSVRNTVMRSELNVFNLNDRKMSK